ncbi:MAG: hypothetical protein G8237_05800 [Magnetococcales bacterium]|nr:hypothetical protein [Magnetococcales bacterium]NGZ05854.1 hypothetical protein [Magnetococcales bacterium]
MNRTIHIFLTVSLFIATPATLMAEPNPISFSAEVTRSRADKKGVSTRGKIHVSPEAIRGETTNKGITTILIHHTTRKTVWILNPSQKNYLERPTTDAGRPPLPDDPNSPCRRDKQILCRQIGPETVENRQTIHWEILTRTADHREHSQTHLWIDPRLRFALREHHADGLIVELTQIQEGVQPAELFQIPQDFQKIAPAPTPGPTR